MSSFGPIILICTIIIGGLILYERKKDDRLYNEKSEQFWTQEAEANTVRKQDITYLNYLHIPIDSLPMNPIDDPYITEYQELVSVLSTQKIINLTGITNTDLKLKYGPANLPALTEYDSNYSILVNTLAKWAERLLALDMTQEAISVLEYGITIHTDVSRNYYMLANIYLQMNRHDEIDRLIKVAQSINSILKPSILKKLQEMNQY